MKIIKLTSLLAFGLIIGCKKEDVDRTAALDFSRPGAIGGSILAGYQDGALSPQGQMNSIPSMLFKQLVEYGGAAILVPAVQDQNGIGLNLKPWESIFQTKSVLGDRVDCNDEVSLGPIKELLIGTSFADINNSSENSGGYQCVPFMTTANMMDAAFGQSISSGNTNPYYHRWAAEPGVSTPVGEIIAYKPTFTTIWLGVDDIFNFAISGGTGPVMPSVSDFRNRLEALLSELADSGSKGVIANVPSIDHFPFFNLIPYNGANLDAEQVDELNGLYSSAGFQDVNFVVGPNGFLTNDPNHPDGVRHLMNGERLLLTTPLDSMRCFFYGLLVNMVADRYTLTLPQVSQIHAATVGYNEVIQEMADKYGFALFDANAFFGKLESGVKWDGADYNLNFVSGGFFSLDGLNPHEKGNVLITNGMIDAINKKYGSKIPNVNCPDCNGVIFP